MSRRVSAKDKDKEEEKKSDNKEVCDKCKVKVEASHLGICCEFCEGWFHIKCVNISKECYEALRIVTGSHWFCDTCNVRVSEVIQSMLRTNERLDQVIKKQNDYNSALTRAEARQETLENKVHAVTKEISQLREEMNKCVTTSEMEAKLENVQAMRKEFGEQFDLTLRSEFFEEQVKNVLKNSADDLGNNPSWSEVVSTHVNNQFETVKDEMEQVKETLHEVKSHADEEREKDSRRNNIILYNVPESDKTRADDRNKDDLDFCLRMFNSQMQLGIGEEDITKTFRLGRRTTTTSTTTPTTRPLMIHMVSYTRKNLIMESLSKLRDAEQQYKKVVIVHDMTQAERDQCKQLVNDAKEMANADTSGEYLYRVRGLPGQMRIVTIRIRR